MGRAVGPVPDGSSGTAALPPVLTLGESHRRGRRKAAGADSSVSGYDFSGLIVFWGAKGVKKASQWLHKPET
jgi:hypothetical protein